MREKKIRQVFTRGAIIEHEDGSVYIIKAIRDYGPSRERLLSLSVVAEADPEHSPANRWVQWQHQCKVIGRVKLQNRRLNGEESK